MSASFRLKVFYMLTKITINTLIKQVFFYIFAGVIIPCQHLLGSPTPGALIIIDMQPEFYATLDYQLVDRVIEEAEKSMGKSWPIYLIETEPELYGPTLRPIKDLIAGYHSLVEILKEDSDGSPGIIADFQRHDFLPKEIRVCGVNTGLCVLTTISGISMEFQKENVEIILVERGCKDADPRRHQIALSLASNLPAVKIHYGCSSE